MSRISYWFSLPRRWWHRHGFNVQSPWAYEFVRDAVSDKSWFYAFDELAGTKSDRQLFRIVFWLRAKEVEAHTDQIITKAHLLAPLSKKGLNARGMIIYYYDEQHLDNFLADMNDGVFNERSCVIMEDIRHSAANLWNTIVNHRFSTSTFDLANRGIALFDPCRQKQNYLL